MVGGDEKAEGADLPLPDATLTVGCGVVRGVLYVRPEACTNRGGCGPCVCAELVPRVTVTLGKAASTPGVVTWKVFVEPYQWVTGLPADGCGGWCIPVIVSATTGAPP